MLEKFLLFAELTLSVLAINGALYGVFHKFIKKPLQDRYNDITNTLKLLQTASDINTRTIEHIKKTTDQHLLPFMSSIQEEFSINSGKSLKDSILRIESNIKREELKTRIIADSLIDIGTFECDSAGNCIWANKKLCQMFGLEFSDMLGRGWLSAICEKDRIKTWKTWQEAIELGVPYESTYNVCNLHTGAILHVRAVADKHIDSSGSWYYGTVVIL